MGKKKGSRKAPTNPKPHGPNLSPLDETPLDKGLVEKEELAILSSFPMKDEREAREAIRLEETAILSQSRQHQTKSSGMLDWLLSSVPPILSASAVLGDDFDAMIDYHLAGGVINRNIDGVNLERPSEEWTQKCAVKSCKRLIRPDSSQFHCSVCAQTFCSSHAGHPSLQIQQDGLWVRACKACWQEKTGLDDAEHMIDRNWTPAFETQRLIRVNQRTKETSMLVGRLEKLVKLKNETNSAGEEKMLQKRLMTWKPDASTDACPHCRSAFTLLNRRHHCRLCGNVICSSNTCSFTVASPHNIRCCPNCYRALSSSTNSPSQSPLASLFQTLASSRSQVLQGLPKFNEYLCMLEEELSNPVRNIKRLDSIRHDAMAVKNTLHLIFGHYVAVRDSIQALQKDDMSQEALLIDNICLASELFLKMHKFSLKMLPDSLDFSAQPTGHLPDSQDGRSVSAPTSPLLPAFIAKLLPSFLMSSLTEIHPSPTEQANIPLPTNLGALMQKLEVLHEQRSQLEAFLEGARVERRFADLASLQQAIDETSREIDEVKLMCNPK